VWVRALLSPWRALDSLRFDVPDRYIDDLPHSHVRRLTLDVHVHSSSLDLVHCLMQRVHCDTLGLWFSDVTDSRVLPLVVAALAQAGTEFEAHCDPLGACDGWRTLFRQLPFVLPAGAIMPRRVAVHLPSDFDWEEDGYEDEGENEFLDRVRPPFSYYPCGLCPHGLAAGVARRAAAGARHANALRGLVPEVAFRFDEDDMEREVVRELLHDFGFERCLRRSASDDEAVVVVAPTLQGGGSPVCCDCASL